MSNSESPIEPINETGSATPIDIEPADDIDYEIAAEVIKMGVDRILSATKRSNGKQIAYQVGECSRNLIALSKACMAGVKKPGIIT